jgi:tRNA nucleotidyltransferase (CCA-adding enzyme)
VEAAPPEPALRWAALLHDCGKPECFSLRDGTGHFHGHPAASERLAREIFAQLRFPKRLAEHIALLLRHHELRLFDGPQSPAHLKRLLRDLGESALLELLELMRADVLAQTPDKNDRLAGYDSLRRQVIALAAARPCLVRKDLAVNGADLLALGFQGPQLGKALDFLLSEVLDGRAENEREALIQSLTLNFDSS